MSIKVRTPCPEFLHFVRAVIGLAPTYYSSDPSAEKIGLKI
jgi:hypothetical protein